MGVNTIMLQAKKALDDAAKAPVTPVGLKKGVSESLKFIIGALKTHKEKKDAAGAGIKKLSDCLTELEQVTKTLPNPTVQAVLKKLKTTTQELDAAAVKSD